MLLYVFLVRFDHKAGYGVFDVQADNSNEAYQEVLKIIEEKIIQVVDSIELIYREG